MSSPSKNEIIKNIEQEMSKIIKSPLATCGSCSAIEASFTRLINVWYFAVFGETDFVAQRYRLFVAQTYGQTNMPLNYWVTREYFWNTELEKAKALVYYLKMFKKALYKEGLARYNKRRNNGAASCS